MAKRRRIVQSIYDPPIILRDDDALKGVHIIRGGADYGHILFTHAPMVVVVGRVFIGGCIFEFIT